MLYIARHGTRADRTERGNKANFPASSFLRWYRGNRAIWSLIKPAPLKETRVQKNKGNRDRIRRNTQGNGNISLHQIRWFKRFLGSPRPALLRFGSAVRGTLPWIFLISPWASKESRLCERCTRNYFPSWSSSRASNSLSPYFDELLCFLSISLSTFQGLDLTISRRRIG